MGKGRDFGPVLFQGEFEVIFRRKNATVWRFLLNPRNRRECCHSEC